ncbi:MAG TPA: hypothetical protein VMD53_13580 [Rhizomicrobium sp.]|nr:hypothetical protein [Rhizomicrobium sp.]
MLVSQDLRDAMALRPQDIEYLPVDASLSAPVPRAKNYMIMRVPVVENISDPDQSDYEPATIDGETIKGADVDKGGIYGG